MCYNINGKKRRSRVGYKIVYPAGDREVSSVVFDFSYVYGKKYCLPVEAKTWTGFNRSEQGFYVYNSLKRALAGFSLRGNGYIVVRCIVDPADFIGTDGKQSSYRSIIIKGRVK